MTRTAVLLTALAAIALLVVSYLFLVKPKMDEVTELEAQAEDLRDEQGQVEAEINALQQVRATSPDLEAELAAIGAIVPDSPALPGALRQLQVAADDSGVTLVSVAPGRPVPLEDATVPELSSISLNLTLEGGYFQVVDFLRRVEDPALTSRGIVVGALTASPAEYPTLSVTMSATMFSLLDQPVAPAPEPTETETATEGDDGEPDVDVDVTVSEEDAA